MMPAKQDRINNPRHGQHPDQDQNEIGTRYEFAYSGAIKGGSIPVYTRIFLSGGPGVLKKQLKDEIHA